MFANNQLQDFVGTISGLVRDRARRVKIKDGVLAIGIRPVTAEAEAWTQAKAEDDITLMLMPIRAGRKLTEAELDMGEKIVAVMKEAKDKAEADRDNGVPRDEVNFTAKGENGYAIYYEVIEHYTAHCAHGGRVALEVYVYINPTREDAAFDALWEPESYIAEWAEANGDKWTQTHRR